MIRMTLALLLCIGIVMLIYGDKTGAPADPVGVAGVEDSAEGGGLFSQIGSLLDTSAAPQGDILDRIPLEDERRAIEAAVAATVPPENPAPPKVQTIHLTASGPVDAPQTQPAPDIAPQETASEEDGDLWYVTGNRVNLRGGPSTSDAVVGQVVLGQAAEVLEETADGWFRIRTRDGADTGYIFGQFLSQNRPG